MTVTCLLDGKQPALEEAGEALELPPLPVPAEAVA